MNVLGIDLGTSAVKIIVMSPQGQIIGESSATYPLYTPSDGWAEQHPDDWWIAVIKAMKQLLESGIITPDSVSCIGLSGQMHGLVMLSQNNKPLYPAILWCDQRTVKECEEITTHFSLKGMFENFGNKALTGFTAPKILWIKKHHPEIFSEIKHILLPKDYINFKLTGEFATDYSDASGMLLLNIKQLEWSGPMLSYLNIDPEQLPGLHHSYEIIGTLTSLAATELGLTGRIDVVAGAGDQAAGAIGTGTVNEGMISVALGTSGVVFAAQDRYRVDSEMRLHTFCHANARYHSMGVMLSAASCLKWWQSNICPEVSINNLLQEAVSSPPGSRGLVFLPYLSGERTPYPDPNARGVLIGMNPNTLREDITRAILEGVAFGLKDSLEIMLSMGIPAEEIRITGGGSINELWLQILADVFGRPVKTIFTAQGSALGAAILAAVGANYYQTVESACIQLIQTNKTYIPDPNHTQLYQTLYAEYQSLYPTLRTWFKDRNAKN